MDVPLHPHPKRTHWLLAALLSILDVLCMNIGADERFAERLKPKKGARDAP